jgi:nicotinamidase-related amidase
MTVYTIAQVEILDPEQRERYKEIAAREIARHGGRHLARGASPEVKEADWEQPENLQVNVVEFPSAFVGTDLDAQLSKVSSRELVLAGFMTHMCVNSTARGAFSLGYHPTVVASATATRDLPGPDGVPVQASALQAASLAAISDLFGVVVGKADDIPG